MFVTCLLASPTWAAIEPGLKLGINSATVSANDDEDDVVERMTGWSAGGSLLMPGRRVGLQAELLYAQKGFDIHADAASGIDASGTLEVRYLEVPLLLRAELAPTNKVRPYLLAGPALAFKLDTGLSVEANTLAVTEADREEVDRNVKSTDVGLAVAAGVRPTIGRIGLEVEARYTHGLSNIDKSVADPGDEPSTARNRVFTFSVGARF